MTRRAPASSKTWWPKLRRTKSRSRCPSTSSLLTSSTNMPPPVLQQLLLASPLAGWWERTSYFNLKLLNGLWRKVKHSFLLCRVWTVDPRALRPTQRRSAGPSRSCGTVRSVCSSGTTSPKGQRTWWTKWSRWPNLAASQSSVRKRRRMRSLFNSLAVLQCFQPAFLLMVRRGWCQHVNEIGLRRSLRESLFGMLSVTSKHFPDLFRVVVTTLKSYWKRHAVFIVDAPYSV